MLRALTATPRRAAERLALYVASMAVLAACAGAPSYQPPRVRVAPAYEGTTERAKVQSQNGAVAARSLSAVPSTSHSAAFTPTLSVVPFWQSLGDTTLTQLIEAALRDGTDISAAEARLVSARASRRLSTFDLAPTITAVGSAMRQQSSIAQVPGLTSRLPQRDLWDVGFDASWELDIFGRVGRSVGARSAFTDAAEHGLDDVQVILAAEVARTYFDMRGSQRQLAVALRNADNQRRTVDLTEDRLTAGRGTAFDTERAKSVLQLTLAAVPAIESRISADRHRIATLLGRPANALPATLRADGELPALPDTVHVGSPGELVRRRPDVRSAERAAAAQGLLVGAAQADYLPRLSIGASVGYAASSFDSLSRSGTSRMLVGPVLSWPLLDLGRVRSRVDIARAQEDEARSRYDAVVLRALEETETAIVTYDRAHSRLAILTQAVESSSRAAELARQRFEAGLTDFLQVLDAQRTQLDAENQLAQAHTTAAVALVALYKATGGTWPVR